MAKEFESKAREYLQKIYSNAGMPLPNGWDDPKILSSLGIEMAKLAFDLATKPKVRQLLYNNSPEKLN